MWSKIISAVISSVAWAVSRNIIAQENADKYVNYIKKFSQNTPSGAEISDEYEDLIRRANEED